MGSEGDYYDRNGMEPVDEAEALRLILALAEALREEFGLGIDAHPGGEGNEAGVVNRAYRAAFNVIVGEVVPSDEMSEAMTRMLRSATLRRLAELDVARDIAERVLDSEAGMGDRWLAYLALAPAEVVKDLAAGG